MKTLNKAKTGQDVQIIYDPALSNNAKSDTQNNVLKLPGALRKAILTSKEQREFNALVEHELGHIVIPICRKYRVIQEIEADQWANSTNVNFKLFTQDFFLQPELKSMIDLNNLNDFLVMTHLGISNQFEWSHNIIQTYRYFKDDIKKFMNTSSRQVRIKILDKIYQKINEERGKQTQKDRERGDPCLGDTPNDDGKGSNLKDNTPGGTNTHDEEQNSIESSKEGFNGVLDSEEVKDKFDPLKMLMEGKGESEERFSVLDTIPIAEDKKGEPTTNGASAMVYIDSTPYMKETRDLSKFIKRVLLNRNTAKLERAIDKILKPFLSGGVGGVAEEGVKVDYKNLHKLKIKDPNVFKGNMRKKKSNSLLCFYWDVSGSMHFPDISTVKTDEYYINMFGKKLPRNGKYRSEVCYEVYKAIQKSTSKLKRKGLDIKNYLFGESVREINNSAPVDNNQGEIDIKQPGDGMTNIYQITEHIKQLKTLRYDSVFVFIVTDVWLQSTETSSCINIINTDRLCKNRGYNFSIVSIGRESIMDNPPFIIEKIVSEESIIESLTNLFNKIKKVNK